MSLKDSAQAPFVLELGRETPTSNSGAPEPAPAQFLDESELEGVDREALAALWGLQDTLFRFPMAAQAAFSALVAEGRKFAETPEGDQLLRRLSSSKRTARARVIWEVLTLSSMTETPTGALPGVLLDQLVRTLAIEKLEPILARLFERR